MITTAQQDPLLTTKLYIPQPRPNLVSRRRLTICLDTILQRQLTLISAPAGFGKTTLLGEWIKTLRSSKLKIQNRVVWISLDEGDNDPFRFLRYLATALQLIEPNLGTAALTALQEMAGPPPVNWTETILSLIINRITPDLAPIVVILDDFHTINAPSTHSLFSFLLEHLPLSLHLVIASRTDPMLPLARLRAEGQLFQLGTADLRFTVEEAATFLNKVMGLNLTADDIATLETRTEGWIAGLQLAALSMQDRQDTASFIASFTGSHRYIFDYLAEEVLNRQPPVVQKFLLQTSLLNRMCGPLCDAILGSPKGHSQGNLEGPTQAPNPVLSDVEAFEIVNGQEMLAYLEQANLFIVPLDDERRWYRYHHLFVEFLRNRLEQLAEVDELTELHRRAAEWYEANSLTAEAAGHALAMADVDRAARLIAQRGRTVLNRSEMSTLLSWIEGLPREFVQVRPRLSLFHAWALVLTGQLDAVEARVQDAERLLRETNHSADIPGELTAIRGTLAYFRRDFAEAIALYSQALDKLPQENLFLRGAVAMSLATAQNLANNLAGAKRAFAQAEAIHQANDNGHMVLIAALNLAQLHLEQGELHQAAESYRRALKIVAEQIEQETISPIAGRIYVGLASVLYQRNELKEAQQHLADGRRLAEQGDDPITLVGADLALAWLKQAQGDVAGALVLLSQTETFCQQNDLPGWRVRLATSQVQLYLGQDDLDEAERWLHRAQLNLQSSGPDDSAGYLDTLRFRIVLAQVRLLIAQKRGAEALEHLQPLHQAAEVQQRWGRLGEILLLQALAHQAQQALTPARIALEKALLRSEKERCLRLFVDEIGPLEKTTAPGAVPRRGRRVHRQTAGASQRSRPASHPAS